jgi:phospholipid/cholesterol/gamma-HCH transport system substrate-binding protein
VKSNRAQLTTDVKGLADITGVLAKQKDAMAEVLEAGPTALTNLVNAYNPSSGTLDTRNNEAQLDDPALYLCSLLTGLGQPESVCDQIKKVFKNKEILLPGQPGGPSLPGLPGGGGGGGSGSGPDLTLGGILGGSQ